MDCGVCSKKFGKHRQATCASCARAALYSPRIEQASLLLDKEKLHGKIQTVLKPPSQIGSSEISTASQFVELTEAARKLDVDNQKGQIRIIERRLDAVREQQQLLRRQIEEARKDNALRTKSHEETRQRLASGKQKFGRQSASELGATDSDCKRLQQRLGKVQQRTMEGRKKLCIETALLADLTKHGSRKRDGKQSEAWYSIGKMPIPDLRELNVMHPDQLNAALAHVVRLLVTTSHYLAVRLPAEVIAPHANFPRPAILSLHSSYRNREGKQRPLHISKPLPLLAKEDTPTYNLFIDGVVLLAYNVAWLCRTQGVSQVDSWEDLCTLGRNIYALYLSDIKDTSSSTDDKTPSAPTFGRFSHANGAANLLSLSMSERIASWTMPSLARVEDKLKSHLLTEMSGAEWEMLDEKEWEEDREDERAVLVGGARWSLAGGESRMGVSYMTATRVADDDEKKDSSGRGWMRVRNRAADE